MDADLLYDKGIDLLRNKDLEEARVCFQMLLTLDSTSGKAERGLGWYYYMTDELDTSKGYFEDALEKNPNWGKLYIDLAMTLEALERFEDANKCYEKAIYLDATKANYYFEYGSNLVTLEKLDDAIIQFNRAIELDSTHSESYLNLGIIYRLQNRFTDAESMFLKSIEHAPECLEAIHNLANTYRLTQRYDEAKTYYNRELLLDPKSLSAIWGMGESYKHMHHIDKALEYAELGLSIEPGYQLFHLLKGNCLQEKYLLNDSLKNYDTAIEIEGIGTGLAHLGKAGCYRMLNKANEAVTEAELALPYLQNKDTSQVNSLLGLIELDKKNYKKAKDYFEYAISIGGRRAQILSSLAYTFLQLGNDKIAYVFLNESLILDNQIGYTYWLIGKYFASTHEESFDYFKSAVGVRVPCFTAYLSLYELTQAKQTGLNNLSYYYLFLRKCPKFDYHVHLTTIVSIAVKECLPMILPRIYNTLKDSELPNISAEIQKLNEISRPFRIQKEKFDSITENEFECLLLDAIYKYYLGDPIGAFDAFDREMEERLDLKLPMIAQYYYYLSALKIGSEDSQKILMYALQQARNLVNSGNHTHSELYYAALLLALDGKGNDAQITLEKLAETGYEAARYACDTMRLQYESNALTQKEILEKLTVFHNSASTIFRSQSKVILPSDPVSQLTNLIPLLHVMENIEIFSELHYLQQDKSISVKINPFENQNYFADRIILSEFQPEELQRYCELNYESILFDIYGNTPSAEQINVATNYYRQSKEKSFDIIIELESELFMRSIWNIDAVKFNKPIKIQPKSFAYYLELLGALETAGILSSSDALALIQYVKYLAETIYLIVPDDPVRKIMFHYVEKLMPEYIQIGKNAIKEVTNVLKLFTSKEPYPVLTYSEFKKKISN